MLTYRQIDIDVVSAEQIGIDVVHVGNIARGSRYGESATDRLLVDWSQTNAKVTQLFKLLHNITHVQAMDILRDIGKYTNLCL